MYRNPLRKRLGADFFKKPPRSAGVYFMRDSAGEILYVGKAANLRVRIRSYCYANPQNVGSNIIKMLAKVRSITWELCENESKAWQRELLLIRAIVPPYNRENAWREQYFFIGLSQSPKQRIDFQLGNSLNSFDDCFEIHGCYPMRRRVKQGYSALLRLLYALNHRQGRFSYPSKITRPSPCYRFSLKFERHRYWRSELSKFLKGESPKFLERMILALLENPEIPEYVRPGIQRDLLSVKSFEEACEISASLRKSYDSEMQFLTHRQLRKTIKNSVVLQDASQGDETVLADTSA